MLCLSIAGIENLINLYWISVGFLFFTDNPDSAYIICMICSGVIDIYEETSHKFQLTALSVLDFRACNPFWNVTQASETTL